MKNSFFVREFHKNNGTVVRINQCMKGDVGHVVWDAAIVLAKYLETEAFLNHSTGFCAWRDKNILELGAGTGIVGIVAATLGAHVILTDLEDLQDLIQRNISDNQMLITGSASFKVLQWGEDITNFHPLPDVILLADCIYYEKSVEPLIDSLRTLAGMDTHIICCYEQRTEGANPGVEKKFFQLLQQFFRSEEIPPEKQDPEFSSPDIRLLRLHRLP